MSNKSVPLKIEFPEEFIEEWKRLLKTNSPADVAKFVIENGYKLPDITITSLE